MSKKTFTTAYNRDVRSIRDVNVMEFTEPSKVAQSLEYATDINEIYRNYTRTGRLPLNGQQPIYDENFVKYDSLIEAQKIISESTEYFNGLPANIKNQYGNSLEKFIFALNNKDEFLIKEGLLQCPDVIKDNEKVIDIPSPTPQETVVSGPVNTATTD